ASMMPVELNRMSRSADAMGPFGSSTPSEQPPSIAAKINKTASAPCRISDLPWVSSAGTARDAERRTYWPDGSRSGARGGRGWPPINSLVDQQRGKQHKQVQNRTPKQTMGGASIGLATPDQSERELNEPRSADDGNRAIDCAGKPQRPRQQRNRHQQHAVDQ